jgi:uncharacterized membrane protein
MNVVGTIKAVFPFTWLDAVAVVWFVACWLGYVRYAAADRLRPRLATETDRYIIEWMTRMVVRDNRMVDVNVMRTLLRSSQFFASTSMVILGALVAMMGYAEKATGVLAELPFAQLVSERAWEIKSLLLVLIFVYAFFKFSWSIRQFGLASILVGAVDKPPEHAEKYALDIKRVSGVVAFANINFNNGLRAYYFGVAALCWFVHPVLMMICSTCIVYVLYEREFHSKTLRLLAGEE